MAILAYRDVRKRFGDRVALDGVGFEVRAGEIFGLLGPNGAGKTTLIRLALDVIRPDDGDVRLFGAPPSPAALDRTSYLPEERGLYRRSRVDDMLVYLARLKGLSRRDAEDRMFAFLERLGLAAHAGAKVASLSKGNQQKVQLAAALLHDPDLAILDEPFTGLDPVNVALVNDLLHERRRAGRTTILSTHLMEKVESLCDRVALVHRGELVLHGTIAEVVGSGATRRSMDDVFVEAVRTREAS